jgi:CubicO group peptidase (beta-lactamase class C family)
MYRVVVGKGAPIAVVSGVADRAAGTRMSAGDLVPLGSATKMYTATLLLQAAQNGTVNLDKPVHEVGGAGTYLVYQLAGAGAGELAERVCTPWLCASSLGAIYM